MFLTDISRNYYFNGIIKTYREVNLYQLIKTLILKRVIYHDILTNIFDNFHFKGAIKT